MESSCGLFGEEFWMTPDRLMDVLNRTIGESVILAGPILGASMLVGLLVAIFQAATQIQESSLSFVPKMGAMVLVLILGGHWLIGRLVQFTVTIFQEMALLGPGAQ